MTKSKKFLFKACQQLCSVLWTFGFGHLLITFLFIKLSFWVYEEVS